MNRKKINKILIFLILISSISVLVIVIVRATLYDPTPELIFPDNVEYVDKTKQISSSLPSTIEIPKIKVIANVQYVGLTKTGKVGTPNNFKDVGWYKYGAIPGDKGSAIIDGHVDNGFGFPGVFKNLEKLEIGDDIYVENVNKEIIHFQVKEKNTYEYNSKVESLFKGKNESLLHLITCTGVWLAQNKTHDKRLVVTAIRVN